MNVCGVTIASNEATLVWIDRDTGNFVSATKVMLDEPYNRDDNLRTMELVRQYLVDRQTQAVVVRKALTSGRYSAGSVAFKLETIIILASPYSITFTSAQALAAFAKKQDIDFSSVPHKYQIEAYVAALSGAV